MKNFRIPRANLFALFLVPVLILLVVVIGVRLNEPKPVTPGPGIAAGNLSESKLSVQLLSSFTSGAATIINANPKVIKFIDPQNHADFVTAMVNYKTANPNGTVILRFMGSYGPYGIGSDPVASAQNFYNKIIKSNLDKLGSNVAYVDYVEGPNECEGTPTCYGPPEMNWNTRFHAKLTELVAAYRSGLKTCIFNIPSGVLDPNDFYYSNPNDGGKNTLDYLLEMKNNQAAFCYHAYTDNYDKDAGFEYNFSLRYRQFQDYFNTVAAGNPNYNPLKNFTYILSEGGMMDAWHEMGRDEQYKTWLAWFDNQLRMDSNVLGVNLFQIGDNLTWKDFDLEYIAPWIHDHLINPGLPPSTTTSTSLSTTVSATTSSGTFTDWKGEYYNMTEDEMSDPPNPDWFNTKKPTLTRNDKDPNGTLGINFNWGSGSPAGGIQTDNFVVKWTRTVNFQAGDYVFSTTSDDGLTFKLDGVPIFDNFWDQGAGRFDSGAIHITAGNHTLFVLYYDHKGDAIAKLRWWPKAEYDSTACITGTDIRSVSATEWKGEYFNNITLGGNPCVVRQDTRADTPGIIKEWTIKSPETEFVRADHFSARWTRTLNFDQGVYYFTAIVDDGMRAFVDNQALTWQGSNPWKSQTESRYVSDPVTLSAGAHTIKVEYFDDTYDAKILFSWVKQQLDSHCTAVTNATSPDWEGRYYSYDRDVYENDANPPPSFSNDICTDTYGTGCSYRFNRNDKDPFGSLGLDFDWDENPPGTGNGQPLVDDVNLFIVSWKRTVNCSSGVYKFSGKTDDGMRIYIGSTKVYDQWQAQQTEFNFEAVISGQQQIRVEYYDGVRDAIAKVNWTYVRAASTTSSSISTSSSSSSTSSSTTSSAVVACGKYDLGGIKGKVPDGKVDISDFGYFKPDYGKKGPQGSAVCNLQSNFVKEVPPNDCWINIIDFGNLKGAMKKYAKDKTCLKD